MELVTKKVAQIDHFKTGERARKARMRSGKSLTSVAIKLGFTPTYLSDLERGRANWNEQLLKRFERAI